MNYIAYRATQKLIQCILLLLGWFVAPILHAKDIDVDEDPKPKPSWIYWLGAGFRFTDDGVHTSSDGANFQYRFDLPTISLDVRNQASDFVLDAELRYFRSSRIRSDLQLADDYKASFYFVADDTILYERTVPEYRLGISKELLHQISWVAGASNNLVPRTTEVYWVAASGKMSFSGFIPSKFIITVERSLFAETYSSSYLDTGTMAGWSTGFKSIVRWWDFWDFSLEFRLLGLFGEREFLSKEYFNISIGYEF